MMQYDRQFQELIDNYPQQLPKYLKLNKMGAIHQYNRNINQMTTPQTSNFTAKRIKHQESRNLDYKWETLKMTKIKCLADFKNYQKQMIITIVQFVINQENVLQIT